MENIFQTAGTVAGIGGLAIALILIIFKKVLSGKLFPKLSQAQSYKIIRQIIIASFCIAALGIIAYIYSLSLKNEGPESDGPKTQQGPVHIETHGKSSPATNVTGDGDVNITYGDETEVKDTAK
jgi:hypothetical protein